MTNTEARIDELKRRILANTQQDYSWETIVARGLLSEYDKNRLAELEGEL